jgi:peptide deformylase
MDLNRLPILPLGDPGLREQSIPVRDPADPAVKADAYRLLGVLRAFRNACGFGAGIAAPQIGLLKRIIIIDQDSAPLVMVNPEILHLHDRQTCFFESCMCLPDLMVMTRRAAEIAVNYRNLDGKTAVLRDISPDTAAVIQHEVDHLDGILLVDRAVDSRGIISRRAYRKDPAYFSHLCQEWR